MKMGHIERSGVYTDSSGTPDESFCMFESDSKDACRYFMGEGEVPPPDESQGRAVGERHCSITACSLPTNWTLTTRILTGNSSKISVGKQRGLAGSGWEEGGSIGTEDVEPDARF